MDCRIIQLLSFLPFYFYSDFQDFVFVYLRGFVVRGVIHILTQMPHFHWATNRKEIVFLHTPMVVVDNCVCVGRGHPEIIYTRVTSPTLKFEIYSTSSNMHIS